ncbi:F0F1 ATP synthase subunit A [Candidatus Bandiella euplotis]|uniref:ATP synthase subunit a n=1 Tax=Candidatus Bandiella euplotis TaxID=1664265 RepID=A0ABZ0UK37_9RICK|nr:F0F1 ATP synthase subunit A [Candidatus Bandiella woodruffii]WPX96022.1 ATP synthase subunit a [Candidatus Bandiella woodruffii]
MLNPLQQFEIYSVFNFSIAGHNFVITNSTIAMLCAYLILLMLCCVACFKVRLIPNKVQVCGEAIFEMIDGLLYATASKNSQNFRPLVFTLFSFILISNSIGLIPIAFTTTSHISITFALAAFVFVLITLIGFIKNGVKYLQILLPKGTPIILAPLMIVIELFAYLARPVSLSIRLAANMTAGHVVLKVLATFVISSGFLGFLPFILLTILTGFEIFIAALQAYIFSVLTCAYLSDALNLH